MKVYGLWRYEYDNDSEMCGMFSTKELAIRAYQVRRAENAQLPFWKQETMCLGIEVYGIDGEEVDETVTDDEMNAEIPR